MVFKILATLFTTGLLLAACGGSTPETRVTGGGIPILLAVNPTTASPGSQVTIRGTGFSLVAQENLVTIGGVSTTAKKYGASKEGGEAITFDLPTTIGPGKGSVLVTVFGDTSNSLTITVTP